VVQFVGIFLDTRLVLLGILDLLMFSLFSGPPSVQRWSSILLDWNLESRSKKLSSSSTGGIFDVPYDEEKNSKNNQKGNPKQYLRIFNGRRQAEASV
jgi:hypothetical protein